MHRLVAVTGEERGRVWNLEPGRNIVGRALGTEVQVVDSRASRKHCAIDVGDELWIEDLGSLNSTYLNGHVISRSRLVPGDRVAIGETEMRLEEKQDDWQDSTVADTEPRARKLRDFEVQLLGHGIVGRSESILNVLDKVAKLSRTDAPVLITGPTGSGKELIAFALHYCSPRKDYEFVTVSCATLSDSLLESELFGHEAGPLPGATAARDGALQYATGGTVFLEEISDMPLGTQARLLRLLEDRCYTRVGSNRVERADCRILLSTGEDLESFVKQRLFREDLYYRVNAIRVDVPSLSERREDIELLAAQYAERYCCNYGLPPKTLTRDALIALDAYNWPGNVRELQACIERAVLMGSSDLIGAGDLQIGAR